MTVTWTFASVTICCTAVNRNAKNVQNVRNYAKYTLKFKLSFLDSKSSPKHIDN